MTSANKRTDQFASEIGQLLRDRRKELGVTQAELAGHVGVSQQQIVKYEKGIGRIPAEKLSALAEWLKIDRSVIFYPLAVLDQASYGGFAEHDGASRGGFADGGASYQAETSADHAAAQLLRDFQRIRDPAARQSILNIVSTLARGDGAAAPPRRKRR